MFFVWSLVSSAIEAARKRHLANFLRSLLQQQRVTKNYEMLIWKNDRAIREMNKLYRPISEPKLNSNLILQNDLIQVFAEKFETLRVSEWRFCPTIWPCEEDSIYFVVYDELDVPLRNCGSQEDQILAPNLFKVGFLKGKTLEENKN
ncbi:unnamed protein product [Caenorhabditis angaria]|uniref:Uncharacterized protein n=1 Tax=Caenorhabditis angaria TaxID=860376 RepID=A0A9P1IA53_9PELO|nr:unnamed protein product [Caenorhabditis angaria]